MKLFVYGSLKPGGWSHHILENQVEDDSVFGHVKGSLYDAGSFPALKLDDLGLVHGLVYELKMPATALMARLDMLEGFPHLFDRTEVVFVAGDLTDVALVYFGKNESLFDGRRIDSGIWEV